MRCLFCKEESSNSKSIEHIIPESLGNTSFILPKGIICDKCNNYFARKVEQPFLDRTDIKSLRFSESIPNKKGVVPSVTGILDGNISVKIHNTTPGIPIRENIKDNIYISIESKDFDINRIKNINQIITPAFTNDSKLENSQIVTRFIAKVALESLALRLYSYDNGIDYLIDEVAFDPLRNYVRQGNIKNWSCSIRRIYDIEKIWLYKYQKLNESDFLLIPVDDNPKNDEENIASFAYFVLALFGLEFVINLSDPEPDGLQPYYQWLKDHNEISPLYYNKNQ